MRRKKDKKKKDNTPEDEYEHGMPTLEAASLELVNPVGNSGLSSPADNDMASGAMNGTASGAMIVEDEEKPTFGQLFAIQLFPWLVGFIGIGAPIAYVIYQYRRARRAGRGANTADLEQSASVRQGGDSIVGEDAVPDIVPSVPEEIQASITENEDNSQHSVGPHSGSGPASTGLTAQMLFELLIRQDRLTPTGLRRTLNQHVANGDITLDEAELIEEMVREEVVLSKEG